MSQSRNDLNRRRFQSEENGRPQPQRPKRQLNEQQLTRLAEENYADPDADWDEFEGDQ